MSRSIGSPSPSRGPSVAREPSTDASHDDLRNELMLMVQKQRARLERLRQEADMQIEYYAKLKKKELEAKKESSAEIISEVTPRLEKIRQEWQKLYSQNLDYETRHKKLTEEYTSIQTRLKVLHDALDSAEQTTGDGRMGVGAMREHLAEIEQDKADLRRKIKRAIECITIDENVLQTRLDEEEQYTFEVKQMLAAVEAEVAATGHMPDAEIRDLEHDLEVIEGRLHEMKQLTSEMQDNFVATRHRRDVMIDEYLKETGGAMREYTRNQYIHDMHVQAMRSISRQIDFLRKQKGTPPPASSRDPALMLKTKVEVYDLLVKEMVTIKDHFKVKGQDKQLVRDTTAKCLRAKAELHAVEGRVAGKDRSRRKRIDEIVDMRQLLNEKLRHEDTLVAQLESLCVELGEDLSHVHELVEKDGFDDYVSSESDPEAEEEFIRLDEEGTADVEAITTSLEYSPDDPAGSEAIQRFAHRPQGPLKDYAEKRSLQLSRRPPKRFGEKMFKPRRLATLEYCLMHMQGNAAAEIAAHLKSRNEAIQAGSYDPRMDRVAPDPGQHARMVALQGQVEAWKEQQRGEARYQYEKASGAAPVSQPTDAALLAGSQQENAVQYLQRGVHGFTAMMFFSGPVSPFQRQVFLTKDFKRLAWRRPPEVEGEQVQDESIPIREIKAVVTGHKTEVFKAHKEAGQTALRENAALSILTTKQTSVDLEFDTSQERDYWAQILTTLINELRPDGIITSVIDSGNVVVQDRSPPSQRSDGEPYDRRQITVALRKA